MTTTRYEAAGVQEHQRCNGDSMESDRGAEATLENRSSEGRVTDSLGGVIKFHGTFQPTVEG